MAGRGRGRRGAPAAPRPRRPRRACRSTASPTCATCSSARARARPRPASPAGRSRRRSCAPFGVEVAQPRHADRLRRGAARATTSRPADFAGVDESPVRCLDADASAAMVEEINRARKANESLGGVYEVRAFGVVPGLGSHVSWEERLDGRLAQAIMSIQAMKGVGIGDGFDLAGRVGSQAHDEIFWSEERGFHRETNRAGGIEGGMTTGDPLVVRGAMKPLPDADQAAALGRHRDQGAGPGAARAHRLVHRARGGRGRRGDGRARAGRRLPREVRRRPHRRRARGRCAPTRSASGGGAGSHRAARSCSSASWAPARRAPRARSRRELGVEPLDSDRELERELGEPIESFFDREGEAAFREREEEVVLRLLDARRRRR